MDRNHKFHNADGLYYVGFCHYELTGYLYQEEIQGLVIGKPVRVFQYFG
jgi:hypothetical protein